MRRSIVGPAHELTIFEDRLNRLCHVRGSPSAWGHPSNLSAPCCLGKAQSTPELVEVSLRTEGQASRHWNAALPICPLDKVAQAMAGGPHAAGHSLVSREVRLR